MNKKQVTALLKVIGKDDARPILKNAYVSLYHGEPHLVATNGYILAAVKLDEYATDILGKMIKREYIERWAKLATGKSRLNGDELKQLLSEQFAASDEPSGEYPNWEQVLPSKSPEGQTVMNFNAEFFKIIQDLDGAENVQVTLHGPLAPMSIETERGYYVVMPMRKV